MNPWFSLLEINCHSQRIYFLKVNFFRPFWRCWRWRNERDFACGESSHRRPWWKRAFRAGISNGRRWHAAGSSWSEEVGGWRPGLQRSTGISPVEARVVATTHSNCSAQICRPISAGSSGQGCWSRRSVGYASLPRRLRRKRSAPFPKICIRNSV